MQTLLFRDPRPLLETLGQDFFRRVPQCPGVYLMRDPSQTVLYVGKAKNLRKRLGSYRVANPDRMPRRHLRMLRAVVRIDLEECADERSALMRESELLLKLRPKFNRAGTWPAPPRFLVWRALAQNLELAVTEKPEAGWEAFGPLGSIARALRNVLARLLWCVIHPHLGPSRMPLGWVHGQFEIVTCLQTRNCAIEPAAWLRELCSGESEAFTQWARGQMPEPSHAFDKVVIETDLKFLSDFFYSPLPRTLWLNFSLNSVPPRLRESKLCRSKSERDSDLLAG